MPRKKEELNKREKAILKFIEKQIMTDGYPPSVREIGKAIGLSSTATVNGNNSTIDLKGFSGFEITLANTVLNLNDVIITNSPVAVELNYLDTLSEIPNVMIRNTIFADNTVAISNNAGRIHLENSVISESANNQFNKINNSSDGYINVKDSKLYSSIVNNGSIIFDGTTILGKENYNVAISGNGI